ncbi:MAG: hypothetical protein ACRDK1_10040 [Solirubrobacterales bacterium]
MARRILGVAWGAIALTLVASAPRAGADGLPVPGVITPSGGVPGPGGTHFVTRTKHGATTIRELGAGGAVLDSRSVPGSYTVPAVALDGSPGGLSANGSTLVLIRPRASFPQSRTHLLILGADGLSVRDRLTLNGDFSFDAISSDGSRLYFIEYLSAADPTRYAVRAYDVAAGELIAKPIVDPNEENPDEMRGYPLTRATSPDGRWAYTLYDGGGKHPFVHALDTAEGHAVCIDTPSLAGRRDLYQLGLGVSGDGSTLTVADEGRPIAVVDTQTFEVRSPGAPPPVPDTGNGDVWRLIIPAVVVATLATGAFILIARRRHPSDLAPHDA